MTGLRIIVAASLSSLLGMRAAAAEPLSRWDRVRDPTRDRAERMLEEALDARVTPFDGFGDLAEVQEFLRSRAFDAAVRIELRGGQALSSPDLWFFLGGALVSADRHRDEDGRRILMKALEAAPESPLAASAWFKVAIASNRLLDFESERQAYGHALALAWDPDERATMYANRAEASMSLGDLHAARDDYTTALALTPSSEVYAIAAWGLAVADARDDDLPDALKYAWTASQMLFPVWNGTQQGVHRVPAIELPSVFYTPEYEIFYYRALGEMASAEHAESDRQRKEKLSRAVAFWDEYLAGARKNGDRWTQNAEFQRRWCVRGLGRDLTPPSASRSREESGSRSRRPPPTRARD